METKIARINELIDYLNKRTEEYNKGVPTITDKEFDDLYFELISLEKETGYINHQSPTQTVHYQNLDILNKVNHNHPMLSLEKTKDYNVIKSFIGNKDAIMMFKMDGLTCSLRYYNGRLVSAETRGNGYVGEDITHNAYVIDTIPKTINYKDELIVDGEVICDTHTFDEEFSKDYKNVRNFAAGSIRLLNSKESEQRKLKFVAWDCIKGFDEENSFLNKLNNLQKLGFEVVPYAVYDKNMDFDVLVEDTNIESTGLAYPIDGLVFKFDDIEYGKSLGATEHHFRNAMALKFYNDEYESRLLDIEWGTGRTNVLTPVAIFETIEIDGCDVSRASLHNVSVLRETLGDSPQMYQKVYVIKSNEIIPQIVKSDISPCYIQDLIIDIPTICPVCGAPTEIVNNDGVETLICTNDDCGGRAINKLDHFCSKKGLDIKGLSKATLEKLIDWEWVSNFEDIYNLHAYRNDWIKKPGFGVASVDKILAAIEDSKNVFAEQFISAIGIPLIGTAVAKDLMKYFDTYEDFRKAAEDHYDFSHLDGFAESKTSAIWSFDFTEADKVQKYLNIVSVDKTANSSVESCKDIKVVITGRVSKFKNRNALKELIEARGGKVVDSISKNTTVLINNDVNSTSSKNVSAKKLGIPIMSEEEFEAMYLTF